VQWYWRRRVIGEQPNQVAGGQVGLDLPRRHAPDAGAFPCGGGASRPFIQSRPDMRILRLALKQLSLAGGHADARPQVLNVGRLQT